jgi:DNA-binding response OmpR family regulator
MAKILLAEDDPTMLSLLRTLLTMESFQVIDLVSAEEDILEVVRREKPDIVLLDVHLPKHNGLDVLRSMRQSEDINQTKVVMTSGMNLKIECMADGADDFLLKPYMPDELIGMIKRQLDLI